MIRAVIIKENGGKGGVGERGYCYKSRKKKASNPRREATARMAMAVKGSRQQQDGGVKVKFIETQFISSDAASFKAVVQRLTGKSPEPHQPAAAPALQRPRPCRPGFPPSGGVAGHRHQAGWAQEQAAGYPIFVPAKQKPHDALAAPDRLEKLHELCDFADLLYATAGTRRDGGSVFPY